MTTKYNPMMLLIQTAITFEFDGMLAASMSNDDPALKKYEILIEIKDSDDWLKIKADENFNILLLRGSEEKWQLQNPNELEKKVDRLGIVNVYKEGNIRKEYHLFDLFIDEMAR